MRALYALIATAFFLVMLGLMVWKITDPSLPWLLIFPALLAGVLGLLFTGASKEGSGP